MGLLSRILFYLSCFSILPPSRKEQEYILSWVQKKNEDADTFLKNSLTQYDCHAHYFLYHIWILFSFFSILAIFPVSIMLILRSFQKTAKQTMLDDICLYPNIPTALKDKYNPVYIKKPLGYLRPRDLKYILKIIFKSGWRPYFILRGVWKIAVYSEIINTYSPKRIWVTQEMVFESSLLTSYLNDFSVEHNNFMHGDNYFSIQVAFSSFNQFWVWDDFYSDLFRSLKCNVDEFHTFAAIDRLTSSLSQRNIIKYYIQESTNPEKFNLVVDNLVKFAKSYGCDLVVRLHPLHKKKYEIEALNARNIEVEAGNIDIIDSIYESKYVCSEFSSVLYQASLLNRTIVIDNTFRERFDIIKDLDVIFLKKLSPLFLVPSQEGFVNKSAD